MVVGDREHDQVVAEQAQKVRDVQVTIIGGAETDRVQAGLVRVRPADETVDYAMAERQTL